MLVDARAAELGIDRVQPEKDAIAELAAFLERAVATRRDLGHHVGELARATASLDTPLLVTVMGEFSSGKSSFVNAFIGAEVAPTGITPTTATINVVRYGRERGGRILAHDGTTLELGWDALMTHLRALTPEAARAIDRVEILVPLPQLEKIHIVDTPGLNSIQPEHEATARAFIARADAIVWVFTAGQGGKASERAALQSIRDEGKRVLGVLNKADQLSVDERREVVEFIAGIARRAGRGRRAGLGTRRARLEARRVEDRMATGPRCSARSRSGFFDRRAHSSAMLALASCRRSSATRRRRSRRSAREPAPPRRPPARAGTSCSRPRARTSTMP